MEKIKIVLELTTEQVKALQNVLSYQQSESRDPRRDRDVKFVSAIYKQIQEETGIKGEFEEYKNRMSAALDGAKLTAGNI